MSITLFRPTTGEQFPISGISALREMLTSGAARYDDFCFYPGADNWKLLRELQITDDALIPLPPVPNANFPAQTPGYPSTTNHQSHTVEVGLTVPTRQNVMAYVAFALGCLAFVFNFFAAIPGIICARIALKQCDEDPSLMGRGWAKAGLILNSIIVFGYLALVVLGGLFYLAIIWGANQR